MFCPVSPADPLTRQEADDPGDVFGLL